MSEVAENMPTLSLLASIRGACIAHEDAAKDAVIYNRRIRTLVETLIVRVNEQGLVGEDKELIDELQDEIEIARSVPGTEGKAYDEDAIVGIIHTLRSRNVKWHEVVGQLNAGGYRSRNGKPFTIENAARIYKQNGSHSVGLKKLRNLMVNDKESGKI